MLNQRWRFDSKVRNKKSSRRRSTQLGLENLEHRHLLAGDLVISEVAASNDRGLEDEDMDNPDWFELFNDGDEPIHLGGWYATDDPEDLTKWQFPATTIDPGEFLIVFASDKDRAESGEELHTNFRLSSAGEYLAIVQADGTTIDVDLTFTQQFTDISYGPEQKDFFFDYVADGSEAQVLIPTSGADGSAWTSVGYDDGAWTTQNLGLGFDAGGEMESLISDNGDTSAMRGANGTAYVRTAFTIDGAVPDLDLFDLNVNYDDGFVAYLNGTEIARSNAPADPTWDSTATQSHGGILAELSFEDFADESVQQMFQVNGSSQFGDDTALVTAVAPFQTGSIFLKDPILFGADYTFSTSMKLDIHTPSGFQSDADGRGGQGMTFVLQSGSEFQLGDGQRSLGLENLGAAFLAIELDSFSDGAFDPDNTLPSHLGINTSSDGSVARVSIPKFNGDAKDVSPEYLWVDYTGATGDMDVYLSDTNTKPAAPTLSAQVDLSDVFAGSPSLWAGWTASSDLAWNGHEVLNWQIETSSTELGLNTERFDIVAFEDLLQTGENVLAIHGLNVDADDDDFLINATLRGTQKDVLFEGESKFFVDPSPGGANGAGTEAPAGEVEFSVEGRVFAEPFMLELIPPTATATIRYTLDGSIPNETSPLYSEPLSISETSRVRAVAFEDGLAPSQTQTESFIQIGSQLTDFEGGVFESNLPIVVVDSFGDSAVNSDAARMGATAMMFIDVNPETGMANILDEPDVSIQAGMRIRGQSSQGWPKKQYAVEGWAESVDYSAGRRLASEASDRNFGPLGLPRDSDWVLNGPYSDKTQLNNHLAFGLYNDVGLYSPRTKLVEVFVNSGSGAVDFDSDYRGTYVLMEKIKIDNNRVDLPDAILDPVADQDPRTVGGYIFKQDKDGARDVNFRTTGHGGPAINLKFVDPDSPSDAQINWMTDFVNKAEEVLYSDNWLDPDEGYRKYFDVDSFVDHFLITELAKEIDGFRLSEYFVLDADGKIAKGPAWDFNLSWSNGNYLTGGKWEGWYSPFRGEYNGISGAQYHWYHRLEDDPSFEAQLVDRWFELRETHFSKESLFAKVDGYVEALTNGSPNYNNPTPDEGSNPISRNFDRWGTVNSYLWPNCFFAGNSPSAECRPSPLPPSMSPNGQPNSYDDYIFIMKDFIENRLQWIDTQFGSPVDFDPPGGFVQPGDQVVLSTDAPGTLYYTTDGTDPRNPQTVFDQTVILPAGSALDYVVPTDATMINACRPSGISLPNPENCFMNPAYELGTHGETWTAGNSGIGYGFGGNVNTDIQAEAQGVNSSTYLRIPFEMTQEQKDTLDGLQLNIKYDDAFVAYLWFDSLRIPVEIARSNAPGGGPVFPITILPFDAVANSDRDDALATAFDEVDITTRRQYARVGTNYLVVQLLNESTADDNLLFDVEVATLSERVVLPDNVIPYTDPIVVNENMEINARTYDATTDEWGSRRREVYFTSLPPIVVTELNYNPAPPTAAEQAAGITDDEAFEWVELMNIGSEPFDLNGVRFSEAIDFGFRESVVLGPGERGVAVRDLEAFEARYGNGINVLGSWEDPVLKQFSDKLNDDGEQIVLTGAVGEPLMDFTYNDVWHPLTDGQGYTLTLVNPNETDRTTWSNAASWRTSDSLGGSPGTSDVGVAPPTGSLVVNELLAASSTGADAIELLNTTANPVNIGNFFLTDDPADVEKFRVAAGTSVPANGYLVLDSSNVNGGFALSDTGGQAILQAADAAGDYLGFRAVRRFDAADPDVTEGIYTNSVGNVDFVPLTSATLGSENAGPTIGPLVVNELMYNPLPGQPEWIELFNSSGQLLELGADRWSIAEAFQYTFPEGASLEPSSYVLLVQGDDGADHAIIASDFRDANSVPADVDIFVYEPTLHGSLNNNGEDLAVGRSLGADQPVIKTELIEYDNNEPWPTNTDGTGNSLSRINANAYGNEPANWISTGGTPGEANPTTSIDLDGDGSIGVGDVDLIYDAIRTGEFDPALDIDGNGEITFGDVSSWLETAGNATLGTPFVAGDANLDGRVDSADLNSVGISWQMDVTSWGQGDFNADGRVNAIDLNDVGRNWLHGVARQARAPRAPLGAHAADAALADGADAIVPADITQARSPRAAVRTLSTTELSGDHSVAPEELSTPNRYRSTTEGRRHVEQSGQHEDTPSDTFDDVADDVFAAW